MAKKKVKQLSMKERWEIDEKLEPEFVIIKKKPKTKKKKKKKR